MDILQDYLAEARELLERAQAEILALEARPNDDELLASLFRAFHTLKGGAGFLDAHHLVDWTHHLEDLLDKLRSHQFPADDRTIDAILRALDVIEEMLEELARGENPGSGPKELGQLIQDLAAGTGSQARPSSPSESASKAQEHESSRAGGPASSTSGETEIAMAPINPPENDPTQPAHISEAEFEAVLDQLYGTGAPGVTTKTLPQSDEMSMDDLANTLGQLQNSVANARPESPSSSKLAVPAESSPTMDTKNHGTTEGRTQVSHASSDLENTLRVDASRLDAVMNQVGELVLLRNRLNSAIALLEENEDLGRIAREMDLAVNDLQANAMGLRMQPCKRIFQSLPRVVRDTSRQLGKEVQLEILGEEVEIDKAVVDALSGPMTHLIRNSLDHGIESPKERQLLQKPARATIRVAAIHLGDKVRIEVSDDGRGIDRQRVIQKAIEKGIISTDQASRLSESEALELICRPGFSTNDQTTELSGRGVGMDVVRETVHRLRGRLDIQTCPGQSTTIAMEFPLTLAILPVLYLRLRREIYALPISAIESLLDIQESRIHRLQGRSVYRLQGGEIRPILDLGRVLHGRPLQLGSESVEGILTERGLILVSELLGNEDSVIKPLDFADENSWYQGATISGRGEVVLILDAPSLLQRSLSYSEAVLS